jgi:hypothetical protein
MKQIFLILNVYDAKIAPQYRTENLGEFGKIWIQLQLNFGLVGCVKSFRIVYKLYKYSLKSSKIDTQPLGEESMTRSIRVLVFLSSFLYYLYVYTFSPN